MGNWLLFILLCVMVMVDAYFTYRKATGVDDTGRKLLAASQLLYLVFIGFIFIFGKIVGATGIAAKSGGSTGGFFAMIAVVAVVFAGLLFLKAKLEAKIKREHGTE